MKDATEPAVTRFDYTVDAGPGSRASIGLLVLQSDQVMEAEFREMTTLPGVAVYHARLANATVVTPETLARMERELPVAADLLPRVLDLKSIGYGCTSGATIIGEDRVAEILHAAHPGAGTSNPLTAAKAALTALGVTRLGLLTPYSLDVTLAMQDRFQASGIPVTTVGTFAQEDDTIVGRITPEAILEATLELGASPDCDGVFISCTNLRAAGIIARAEAALGKPVTASNQALAWHLLRLAGIGDDVPGYGRLFQAGLPG